MNISEKLCLRWNDFQENTSSAFGKLRGEKDFSDVTLACADGQQMEAHRAVLASCSPLFKTLLLRFKHPHQVLYMRGLKADDLVAVLDFIYYGETSVYKEDLDSFLALAEEFQLKGLTERDEVKEEDREILLEKGDLFQNHLNVESSNVKDNSNHKDSMTVALSANNVKTLDDEINSMIALNGSGTRARFCKICGKVGKVTTVKQHVEANHINGVNHSCEICGKLSRWKNIFRGTWISLPLMHVFAGPEMLQGITKETTT